MREAINGPAIVKRIKAKAGINIEIITGNNEAELIFNSQNASLGKLLTNSLYIDVGGGSTEITIFSKGKAVAAKSFNIGTIRILQNQVGKKEWNQLRDWVKLKAGKLKNFTLIGSGGNINRIAKLVNLKRYSYDDRMMLFDLNPDRADVIVPAGEIFITIMKLMNSDKIYVPKIGLGDGIVREVYKEYLNGKKSRLV
jgi:exopolyphosphatase/guanosine-5'-triphosphate,3'-diphosphate pyrophosphatase